MTQPETRQWLTAHECAARFGITRATWWKWTQRGIAPKAVRFAPQTTRWSLAEVDAFERSRREAAA